MSLSPFKRSTIAPEDTEISVVDADPRIVPATDLLRAFQAKLEEVSRDREIAICEHFLRDKPVKPAGMIVDTKLMTITDYSQDTRQREMLAKLKRERDRGTPTAPAPPDPDIASKTILDGLAVIKGVPFVPPPAYAAQIAQFDRQIAALNAAISEQTKLIEDLRDELTYEYAQKLVPVWNELQREFFRSAQEMARNFDRVQQFRHRITQAGIRSRPDILGQPTVRAPLVLGSESEWDSEIRQWGRILEQNGILK
jgi:hypothetical protein